MKEQLIGFKTAKLAKEKGFDWECNSLYRTPSIYGISVFNNSKNFNPTEKQTDYNDWFSAPTQSLLQKWLREKYRIDIDITRCTVQNHNDGVGYQYEFNENDGEDGGSCFTIFNSYEEALEKGLYESLKLINND